MGDAIVATPTATGGLYEAEVDAGTWLAVDVAEALWVEAAIAVVAEAAPQMPQVRTQSRRTWAELEHEVLRAGQYSLASIQSGAGGVLEEALKLLVAGLLALALYAPVKPLLSWELPGFGGVLVLGLRVL